MVEINSNIMVAYLNRAYHDIEYILSNRDYKTTEELVSDIVTENDKVINIKDKNIKITTLHMFIVVMLCHIENDKLLLRKLYYYQLYILANAFCYSKSIGQVNLNKIVDEMINT